jgi:hypothetical protein
MIRDDATQEQQKFVGWVDGQTGARITWQAAGISEPFTEFCRDQQQALNALRSLERCSRSVVVAVELVPLEAARARPGRMPARVRQLALPALRQA